MVAEVEALRGAGPRLPTLRGYVAFLFRFRFWVLGGWVGLAAAEGGAPRVQLTPSAAAHAAQGAPL